MRTILSILLAAILASAALHAGAGWTNDGPCEPDETAQECNDRYAFPPIDTGDYTLEQLASMNDEELVALSETIDPKIAKNLHRLAKREAQRREISVLWGIEEYRRDVRRETVLLEACEAALETGKPVDDVERVFPSTSQLVLIRLQSAAAFPTSKIIAEFADDGEETSATSEDLLEQKRELSDRRHECSNAYFKRFPGENSK